MAKKSQTQPRNFEDALSELEQIVADIEAGKIGLEESLLRYERGTFLIGHCRGVLSAAEKQVELLSKADDGGIQAVPMQPSGQLSAASETEDVG